MKRLLIVDDQPLFRFALREYLNSLIAEIHDEPIEIDEAASFDDAIERLNSDHSPDLVLLDLALDSEHVGLTTLERFQQNNFQKIPVAVFTGLSPGTAGSIDIFRSCINDLNACGILLKEHELDTMLTGLARILAGELWIPYELLMELTTRTPKPNHDSNCSPGLTPRQWEVAKCLTRGLQDKQIARELDLSYHYIRQVTSVIYQKLQVKNRTEAVINLGQILD